MTSRLYKIGDALSQLANVLLLPKHHQTNANESISGRAYRMRWLRTQIVIDWLFSPFESDHCKKSHEADIERAKDLLKQDKYYG